MRQGTTAVVPTSTLLLIRCADFSFIVRAAHTDGALSAASLATVFIYSENSPSRPAALKGGGFFMWMLAAVKAITKNMESRMAVPKTIRKALSRRTESVVMCPRFC